MKERRHHNTKGYRQIQNGKTVEQVKQMANRLMKECMWEYDDIDNVWKTSCNHYHYFPEGEIIENFYKYCPYCGKEIQVKK